MDLKERLRRAANLFVEITPEGEAGHTSGPVRPTEDEEPAPRPTRTIEDMVRQSEGPDLDAIALPDPPAFAAAPVASGDFAAIYEQAGLPQAQFTAEQAVEMLRSLPPELPLAMKRQMMTISLNSMGKMVGASAETIVADASRKLAALAAYGGSVGQQTSTLLSEKEQEIAALQAEIEARRGEMTQAQEHLASVLKQCHDEADRIDDVLEFFSLDVPPSRNSVGTM